MLSQKYDFDSPVISEKPAEVITPVPVETPKPKKVIVIKKTPDGKI